VQGFDWIPKFDEIDFCGYLEGFYYKPRVDKELLRQYHEGLIALSACLKGEVANRLLKQGYEAQKNSAKEYRDIFADDFYLEVQNHGIQEEDQVRAELIRLGNELASRWWPPMTYTT
jgi:DNA polymerase-3 subunit alpha